MLYCRKMKGGRSFLPPSCTIPRGSKTHPIFSFCSLREKLWGPELWERESGLGYFPQLCWATRYKPNHPLGPALLLAMGQGCSRREAACMGRETPEVCLYSSPHPESSTLKVFSLGFCFSSCLLSLGSWCTSAPVCWAQSFSAFPA